MTYADAAVRTTRTVWLINAFVGYRSVDPSHLPSRRLHANDRRNAQAVHTSISPITNEAKQALKREADHLSSNDDEDGRVSDESEDDEAEDDESGHALSRHRRRRERRERARRKAEMKRGRIPAPPIPDLRFEQGVLLSIRPYLHSTPSSSSQGNVESPLDEKRRKRRHGEENVAIVSASFTAEGADKQVDNDLFQPGLRIEWSKVVYVLLRDQV